MPKKTNNAPPLQLLARTECTNATGVDPSGYSNCHPCSAGSVTGADPDGGQLPRCTQCTPATFSPFDGGTVCQHCATGTVSDSKFTSCSERLRPLSAPSAPFLLEEAAVHARVVGMWGRSRPHSCSHNKSPFASAASCLPWWPFLACRRAAKPPTLTPATHHLFQSRRATPASAATTARSATLGRTRPAPTSRPASASRAPRARAG